ncbi:MarR family winged helix-turn-helix transcriptional regulator [Sporosarcina sp. Te-1]|uniref:MarR family winged helix-turn-helix transcriptional regulator n=1 Tax=Sporosarcina sp. Te-1 TaxID=2818390 RepID=UPI001A9E74B7|nr:MarR family transcriptional regulator [Sporosarcina sp. Te-1]QTD40230.1 MarR family transcriptional regulator [Sporosarcina sp. Te-1]
MKKELIQTVKELNRTIYEINLVLMQRYGSQIDSEITSKQAVVLEILYKHERLTVSEIADLMKVSSSAVSQIISKLDKKNYVRREINPNNRREIIVVLGDEGVKYFEVRDRIDQTIIEKYYAHLDFEEVENVKNTFLKLKVIVEKDMNQPEN